MYRAPTFDLALAGLSPSAIDERVDAALAQVEPGGAFVLELGRNPLPVCLRWLADRPDAFFWSPLRWRPGRWRVEIGRRESADGPLTLYEALTYDHERLGALLTRVAEATGDPATVAETVDALRIGWVRHRSIEEELLFPAFRYAEHLRFGPLTEVLSDQHQVLDRTLDRLIDSRDRVDLVSHFRLTFDAHTDKEETSLLPISDDALAPEKRRQIVDALRTWTPGSDGEGRA